LPLLPLPPSSSPPSGPRRTPTTSCRSSADAESGCASTRTLVNDCAD